MVSPHVPALKPLPYESRRLLLLDPGENVGLRTLACITLDLVASVVAEP